MTPRNHPLESTKSLFLYALYITGEILVPVIIAFLLKMVLQPATELLVTFHLPRFLAALLVVGVLLGGVSGLARSYPGRRPGGSPTYRKISPRSSDTSTVSVPSHATSSRPARMSRNWATTTLRRRPVTGWPVDLGQLS